MWTLAAPSVVFLAFAGCLAVVRARRRHPAALELLQAFSLLVCGEALAVYVLSAAGIIGRPGLFAANAALGVGGFTFASVLRRRRGAGTRRSALPPRRALAWIALLGVIPIVSGLWLPNNYDSMTYHLSRVAYWIQNGTAAAYPTAISRQVLLPPGAEYLVLAIQGIAGHDRLSFLVQLTAWALVALSAEPLARIFGAPRFVARWATPVVAASPMALLQASSTQTDLVAAATALGLVAAGLPFLHLRRPRVGLGDALQLAAGAAAAVLVKPTGAIAAFPFVGWALAGGVLGAGRARPAAGLRAAAAGVALFIAVLAPAWALRGGARDTGAITAPYIYDLATGLGPRAANVVRGFARHIPIPDALERSLVPRGTMPGCPPGNGLCIADAFSASEDTARCPVQATILLALATLVALRWRRLTHLARGGAVVLVMAWVLFHFVVRDNPWVSRLHLPLLSLLPAGMGAVAGLDVRRIAPRAALAIVAVVSAAYGTRFAVMNFSRRPPYTPARLAAATSPAAYYRLKSEMSERHEAALRTLRDTGCRRLGLRLREDDYDYPLSWRAMQAGVEVRHLLAPHDWPCVVYSEIGEPPLRQDGRRWRVAAAPFVWAAP